MLFFFKMWAPLIAIFLFDQKVIIATQFILDNASLLCFPVSAWLAGQAS